MSNESVYLPGKIRDRIQDLMKSRKVTQAELATRIGCSESSLSRFISGKTDKLGDENIIRIARVFNVSTDFLLGEVDTPDRLNYDIAELGLSVQAARNLYTHKVNPRVVNALLENPEFANTTNLISGYLDDELAKVLSDCFDANEYLNRIYDSWKRTTERIFDDVTLFERINQYFIAKKRGYKNVKDYKKSVIAEQDTARNKLNRVLTVIDDARWLYEKFGEGEYRDIPGLCKVASRTEIAEKNYSLTPGAYVGVAAVEDDGVDFAQRMVEIHEELLTLQAESNELMQTISKNMKEMGL